MPLDATAKYAVLIGGKLYPWNTDSITVQEIRELGVLPPNCAMIEEDLQRSAQRSLDEGDVHQSPRLQEGKEFTKKVNFKRG
ncbi:MAG: hypothetical protein H0V41_13640 [Pseudonocardiales bacterium]|nr:hypothetical protein [Pseudonocardiales bacterium]